MKSPDELAERLARQWHNTELRTERLLSGSQKWPISLPIGRPKPSLLERDLDAVLRHISKWRDIRVGKVVWESSSFRAAAEPIQYPAHWELRDAGEWVAACGDRDVRGEWTRLEALIEKTQPIFHRTLVRRPALWRSRSDTEVAQAAQLAFELEPGCAGGRPLRTISLAGIDTKFFERNKTLITALLDARHDGEAGRLGLHCFLDAASEGENWLLVVDLDGGLLPFRRQRVSSTELGGMRPPGRRLIIVENESSLDQLPSAPETVAVLGAGFDLTWTTAPWLREKTVAYWGDIDSWGLQFLATARQAVPHLTPLLMGAEVFDAHKDCAVREPVHASSKAPRGLTASERALYERLLQEERGRLEQEFLPASLVQESVLKWSV